MAEPPGRAPEEINEARLRQACLKIQNDPRLSVGEKKRQISVLTGSGLGAMGSAELYGRHAE